MSPLGAALRSCLLVAFVVAAAGALSISCNAELESTCFDGQPCTPEQGGGGSGTTKTTSSTTKPVGADGDIPCDVFVVLETKCHVCHNANHDGGAPIDLLACSRFAETDCGGATPRHETAASYVDSDFMPLGPMDQDLTADEKATLLGWLQEGAPCVTKGDGCTAATGAKACFE